MKFTELMTAALCSVLGATATFAETEPQHLKVVGTWGYLNTWPEVERPFWEETLNEASGGNLTVEASPMTELGLKGFEIMRMMQLGIFDVGHGIISYLGDDAVAEGADLAGIVQNFEQAEAAADAYSPVLAESFAQSYDARLLAVYPFPSNLMYCNTPVSTLSDLEGLKIRSYSKSMSDLISGLGATPVTIPFGEVVPALQLGTVDCGITGTLPAYTSGWGDVTTHLVRISTGYALSYAAMSNSAWDRIDEGTRSLIMDNVESLSDRAWDVAKRDDAAGIACLTDGPCSHGEPAGLVNVELSDSDKETLANVLAGSVLGSFADRCDDGCILRWNDTIGQVTDLAIAQ